MGVEALTMTTRYDVASASLSQVNVAPSAVVLPFSTARPLTTPGLSVTAFAWLAPMPARVQPAASTPPAQASVRCLNFGVTIDPSLVSSPVSRAPERRELTESNSIDTVSRE